MKETQLPPWGTKLPIVSCVSAYNLVVTEDTNWNYQSSAAIARFIENEGDTVLLITPTCGRELGDTKSPDFRKQTRSLVWWVAESLFQWASESCYISH